jgi:Protein of unknown function (DUF3987)
MPRLLKKPWLDSYLDYVTDLEAPINYKMWSGLSIIASSLKKNVYITRGFYKIYANQYIILVGPPGIGKGTSINPAIGLVKRSGTANYLSDRITAEKILMKLEQGFPHTVIQTPTQQQQTQQVTFTTNDSTATIISTELPIFLGTSEWLIPLLCELWEKGEFSYETKTKGSVSATGLCVSLFGACVPDYIRNLSKDSTAFISSGFSSRCIFVFANERGNPIPWPEINGNLTGLENNLIDDLKVINNLHGEFKLTKEAMKLWNEFYANSISPNEFESDIVSNFRARMVSHVIKLSMCLSVSEKDDLIITKTNLYNSMSIIEDIRKKLDIAFRSVGESPLAVAQDRILRYIQTQGLVNRSKILRDNMRHITDDDLTKVLYVLEYANYINSVQMSNKTFYEPTDKSYQRRKSVSTSGNP